MRKTTLTSLAAGVLAMGLGFSPAAAQTANPPTKTATKAAEGSIRDVTLQVRRYNEQEHKLLETAAAGDPKTGLPAPDLMAHWGELAALRAKLERLEKRGAFRSLGEGDRIGLRHELAELLSGAIDVAQTQGDYVAEKVADADARRKQNLIGIARLVNRSLDFSIHEVLGAPVEGAGNES